MPEWKSTKIGKVADIFDGPHATPEKTTTGPWFLSISSLNKGRLDLSESAHVSEEDFKRWTRRVTPREGDVLFSYETRLGEAAPMPSNVRACLGRRMAILRPRSGEVDSRFLLYAYLGPEFQQTIGQRSVRGATVDRIPLVDLPEWPIRLPGLDEQQGIAAILGAIDDKIEVNSEIAAISDKLIRAHYVRLCQGSYETIQIGELGTLVRETVPAESLTGSENYIGLEHIPRRHMWLSVWQSSVGVASAKTRFREGDILFGKLRPYFHKVGYALTQGVSSTDIFIIKPKLDAFRGWLLAGLCSDDVVAHASAVGDGTRMPRAKWNDIASYEIPWIGCEAATRFGDYTSALGDRTASAYAESRTLIELRDILLPKLMVGQIRVKEAEKVIEDAT